MKTSDVMSQYVVSIAPDAPVVEAARLMLKHDISGLPVIQPGHGLVGMLTEGDLLRRKELGTEQRRKRWVETLIDPAALQQDAAHAQSRTVGDAMTHDVVTVTEDTPIRAVVRLMEIHDIKRLPVVRGPLVVGMISRRDVLKPLAQTAVDDSAAPGTGS